MVYTSVQGHLKINSAYGLSKKRWSLKSKLSRYSKLNDLGAVNCSVHLQKSVSREKRHIEYSLCLLMRLAV